MNPPEPLYEALLNLYSKDQLIKALLTIRHESKQDIVLAMAQYALGVPFLPKPPVTSSVPRTGRPPTESPPKILVCGGQNRKPVIDNEGTIYPSISAAAEKMGVSDASRISRAIRKNWKVKGKTFRFYFKQETKKPGSNQRSVVNHQGESFPSVKAAAESLGVSPSTLSRAIEKDSPVNGYLFQYAPEVADLPTPEKPRSGKISFK